MGYFPPRIQGIKLTIVFDDGSELTEAADGLSYTSWGLERTCVALAKRMSGMIRAKTDFLVKNRG